MNKYIKQIKEKILESSLDGTNMVLVDANELLTLRLKAQERDSKTVLSPEHLTMKQLGSYLPSFEILSGKTDTFKRDVGLFCSNLLKSEAWTYLITHLKQDQVNLSLFSDDTSAPNRNEQFTRGSINGIFVVEDQINLLGLSYDEMVKKGINQ